MWVFVILSVNMYLLYLLNFSTWFTLVLSDKKVEGAVEISLPISSGLNNFPDEPLQIIQPDPDHKGLQIVKKNVKLLQMIKGPVATVAVVGKFHSGKSFLLNQLMGKSQGFGIGPYVRPQTMGVWMWGRPLMMELSSKKSVSVIFLDTEGFAANNVSENYDAKIFAVSTLISSHLIYNSIKIIDQADIDYLELLARRTQLFALRSQMSKARWTDEFIPDLLSFPPLIWVVQDFVQATEDGETHKQWLHRLMDTHSRENEDYEISLLDIFKSVDCHTLFLPATKKSLLMDLSKAKESDLTQEYREERDELISKLKGRLIPKEKNNKPITGVELATLLEILVVAANEGSLSEVPSRWNAFIERLKQTATEDCLKFYEAEMLGFLAKYGGGPVSSHELQECHNHVLAKSNHLLMQLLRGLDDAMSEAKRKLLQEISLSNQKIEELNEKKIRLRCSELQHRIELEAEQSLQSLSLPMTTSILQFKVSLIITNSQDNFKAQIGNLIEEDIQDSYLKSLKRTIENLGEGLELKNSKILENTFHSAVKLSLEKFVKSSKNTGNMPRKPSSLARVIETSNLAAIKIFDYHCQKFKEETLYKLYFSDLKHQITENVKTLSRENEMLVENLVTTQVTAFEKQFNDRTSADNLHFPMNTEDLQSRLKLETAKTEREYHDAIFEFSEYDAPIQGFKHLKEKLKQICNQREKENVEAYMKEVEQPLGRAKQLILLSADKYSTVFSLKQYMRSVCMVNLNEGIPNLWPVDLKETIIKRFMELDEQLNNLIEERKSMWSSFVGFFQWVFSYMWKFFNWH